MDVSMPARYSRQLLDVFILALAIAGAIIGPVLTLRAMPPDFPAWAVTTLIAFEVVLPPTTALLFVHRKDRRGTGKRE
ncbi:hypothetical protein [Kibdelosporangium phytohabitans]|uniref:hypothetical protein n=1 Tax=Kibdelosporangium phytohabitans TaxID=860235 RepID=UPI0012FAEB46|nr:hypothetical protein [Kibdelosporangium phytohabitans]MBE1463126.1 hypothetical protein [Kibdelosporangium phytohabitans]